MNCACRSPRFAARAAAMRTTPCWSAHRMVLFMPQLSPIPVLPGRRVWPVLPNVDRDIRHGSRYERLMQRAWAHVTLDKHGIPAVRSPGRRTGARIRGVLTDAAHG